MCQLWRIPFFWRRRLPLFGIAKGVVVRGRGMEEGGDRVSITAVEGARDGIEGSLLPPAARLSCRSIIHSLIETTGGNHFGASGKYSTIRALARIIESNYGHLWGGGRHSPRQPKVRGRGGGGGAIEKY